jgi:hypothetical protein
MEVVGTPKQLQSRHPLLSVWLLSSLLPELGRELQDIALGPAGQQREDVAQVGPGLDLWRWQLAISVVAMAFHSAPSSLPQKVQ